MRSIVVTILLWLDFLDTELGIFLQPLRVQEIAGRPGGREVAEAMDDPALIVSSPKIRQCSTS